MQEYLKQHIPGEVVSQSGIHASYFEDKPYEHKPLLII